MQLHSSHRQDPVVAAVVLNVVKDPETVKASEPFHLHVASKVQYTTVRKTSNPYRRYTIDDNGGSYEGL